MTERWEEVARVFGLAMDAPFEARAAILDEACGDDDALREEVEELLAADATGDDIVGKLGDVVAALAPGLDRDDALGEVGLASGQVIDGRYALGEVLGRGGMGIVVAAEHESLGEAVAIKVLKPAAMENERARQRFLREARAAAGIQNPHVVKVRDVGQLPSGAPYLVMDRLRGVDLAAVIAQRGPLPVVEACLIALQVCEALATAHASGVVHRDIKPGNIFLERATHGDLSVKLLDFGISKVSPDGDDEVLTGTSDLVGSPAYMSPEQLRASRDVDARADIWSLGVVLYEMLSGARPFRADSVADVSMMILVEPPPPLGEGLPPALLRIVEHCLCKRREGRFATVGEVAVALAPFCRAEGQRHVRRIRAVLGEGASEETSVDLADTVAAAPLEVERPERRPAPSRLPWVVAAGAVGLVAVLALRDPAARTHPTTPTSNSSTVAPAALSAAPSASVSSPVSSATVSTTKPEPASPTLPPAAPRIAPRPAPTIDPYATRP